MSNPLTVAALSVLLIALSAFFVAVEFASLAAKRHRLEDLSGRSRGARAALRSSSELTVLLAGSQLGITACTLALGAITKPAVHHWLTPWFASWGVPAWTADLAGFVLALLVVTFLHLVVGEMAPKSWAIAHPEASAISLAVPMRAFMWLTRPLLRALNSAANWCLHRAGVEPVAEVAAGQSPDDLRHLVQHSADVGSLDVHYSAQLGGALELQALTVGDLVRREPGTSVPAGATVADVRAASVSSGHLRILVSDGVAVTGVVHVRDTLRTADSQPVSAVARPVFSVVAETPVYQAITSMRETRNHLAAVTENGSFAGVITLADLLERLFRQPA